MKFILCLVSSLGSGPDIYMGLDQTISLLGLELGLGHVLYLENVSEHFNVVTSL